MRLLFGILIALVFAARPATPAFLEALLGDSTTWRYKLTFNVSTPDGVKSASSVVEIKSEVSGSYVKTGVADHVNGEALYLDLGTGRRPIVALIWRPVELRRSRTNTRWGEESPSGLLRALMGITHKPNYNYQTDFLDEIRRMKSNKGIYNVEPRDLPDLVTFSDVADPNSVMVVDAEHLDTTLGPDVAWQSITIQIVDEPVTRGIQEKLPWLKPMKNDAHLDGDCCDVYAKHNLSNKLQQHNFRDPY
jgi:hypothetical protein